MKYVKARAISDLLNEFLREEGLETPLHSLGIQS